MTLYRLTFSNGKMYIGITSRALKHRFWDHIQASRARKNKSVLYAAWRKHGEPKLEVLGEFTELGALRAAERDAVQQFKTMVPHGYNMTPGGDSNPMDVPEIARRVGDINKGWVFTDEHRRNLSAARTGKPLQAQHRANISAGQLGNRCTQETKDKIAAKARGRPVSEATRAIWSAQRKGVSTGPMSEETKRKLSVAKRAHWERMRKDNPDELKKIVDRAAQGVKRSWDRRKSQWA